MKWNHVEVKCYYQVHVEVKRYDHQEHVERGSGGSPSTSRDDPLWVSLISVLTTPTASEDRSLDTFQVSLIPGRPPVTTFEGSGILFLEFD
jgi:hypothetical protein